MKGLPRLVSGCETKRQLTSKPAWSLLPCSGLDHFRGVDLAGSANRRLKATGTLPNVSFRVRDQIYWTRKKVRLPKGERVITDGVHYSRVRCGNRISEVPQPTTTPEVPEEATIE